MYLYYERPCLNPAYLRVVYGAYYMYYMHNAIRYALSHKMIFAVLDE